ncbi:ABC transporter ATP-binding protein [Plantactinospora sp. B5E13]|uniref:ABC transporter ATP-binding protein n=1 Tax=unclassified Plantactinospora TaxID=2631981 RepID=UPI00325F9370
MPPFYLKGVPADDPRSGITGSTDLAEPEPTRRPARSVSAALGEARRSVVTTVRGIPRMLRLVWRVSPLLTLGLAATTVVVGLVPAATALISRLLIDAVTHAVAVRSTGLPDQGVVGPLAGVSWQTTATGAVVATISLQFLVFFLGALASSLRNVTTELLQERVSQDVQLRVMTQASRLDLAFFEDSSSYDLVRQAQEESSTRPVAMITSLYGALQSVVTFGSLVALLVALSPWVALAALVAPIPAFLADSRYGKAGFVVAVWSSPIRRRMRYLSSLVTTDAYAKEVKLFGLGDYLADRFRGLGLVFYRRKRQQVVARSLATTGLGAITIGVGSLTYLYIALQAVAGRLTLGDLVMYTAATAALQMSIQTLFREITGVYENNLYLDTLHRLLAARPAVTGPDRPVPMPEPLRGHLVFEHVTFRYPGAETAALRDVSFEVPPGGTLAVVGRNGAGKSTLVKLLCRLYDPDQGRILLDGVDLRRFDPEQLRSAISATFQDYVTYQATAAENIGLGDRTRIEDADRVRTAAVRGGAHELVAGLPSGYDTPLGKWFDRGVNLSGGEWQKIALSRAFMRDARILVFDEPTAALDPASEHELFVRLRELAQGRTTVYVSHRFSTVRQADRILHFADGRLTEQGTHAELIARDGDYARLFLMQASAYLDPPPADGSAAEPDPDPTALSKGRL